MLKIDLRISTANINKNKIEVEFLIPRICQFKIYHLVDIQLENCCKLNLIK